MKYVLKINTLYNTANCNRHFFPSCSLEWYYWALLGLAGIVAILVLTCCCCCCCSCCRSKKPRGGGVVPMTRKYHVETLARFHKMIFWMSLRNVYHISLLSQVFIQSSCWKTTVPQHMEFGCFFRTGKTRGIYQNDSKFFAQGMYLDSVRTQPQPLNFFRKFLIGEHTSNEMMLFPAAMKLWSR